MKSLEQVQHRHGVEAAEIAIDIDAEFAVARLAAMEADPRTDTDYLAGFRSVVAPTERRVMGNDCGPGPLCD